MMDSNVPTAEAREFAMLDPDQVSTLNALERMGATLSLFGISLIFVTFGVFKRLRTIPNTFIFFASIANIGACVACLIAYDGITAMNKNRFSPLCQAQGFIFEWFMQSDPWWSFAMAINVYMVFFMSFNPVVFRDFLWLYCLLCYGMPAIPAFVFLFIRFPGEPVYGDAVLWCWIASKWNSLRIYSYYLPIWCCSVLSAVIYFAVGWHVFHQRNQLRNLSLSNQGRYATADFSDVRSSAEKNSAIHSGRGYYGTVTTEVQVTSAAIGANPLPAYTNPFSREASPKKSNSPARRPSENNNNIPTLRITASVESSSSAAAAAELDALDPLDMFPQPAHHHLHHNGPVNTSGATLAPTVPAAHNKSPWFPFAAVSTEAVVESSPTATLVGTTSSSTTSSGVPATSQARSSKHHHHHHHHHHYSSNNFEATSHGFGAANYTSISAGFSSPGSDDDRGPSPTRLLSRRAAKRSTKDDDDDDDDDDDYDYIEDHRRIMVLPPPPRRAAMRSRVDTKHDDGLSHHHHHKHHHHHHHQNRRGGGGGNKAAHHQENHHNLLRRLSHGTRRFGARLRHMDPVKLAYLRTSFVFAISILVTWTPSSINRVYTLIYPDRASFGLNLAAAVVLPLQGVWNAVIYFTTSWTIFREEVEATRSGRRVLRWLGLPAVRSRRRRAALDGEEDEEEEAAARAAAVRGTTTRHGSVGGGSFALRGRGSSTSGAAGTGRASRSERGGRGGEGGGLDDGGEEVELQSPLSSPSMLPRRAHSVRAPLSTMRVTQKGLDDFA